MKADPQEVNRHLSLGDAGEVMILEKST